MELLKVREVAEKLRVSPITVRRMISAGEIKAIRFSKRSIRIPKEELERILSTYKT